MIVKKITRLDKASFMSIIACSGNEDGVGSVYSWQLVEPESNQREQTCSGASVHIWQAFFSSWRSQATRLTQSLSGQERERMQRFRDPEMAARYAIGHGLLRELLGKYTGAAPAAIEISTNAYGKPELVTTAETTMYFNLAHTDEIVLYGFTGMYPIGVDVESIESGPVSFLEARRILSTDEWASWQELPDEERNSLFYQTWVRKESVLKALGTGLSIEPDTFSVGFAPQPPIIHVQATTLCIRDLFIKASVKASVALTDGKMPRICCFTATALE
jgi:4'-phosphopantetheinyl transferase